MTDDLLGTLNVLAPPFVHDGGHCYRAALPQSVFDLCDDSARPAHSRLVLYEDGVALRSRHPEHAEIREKGRGRYSFWRGSVYFSATDNSDPNAAPHRYAWRLADAESAAPSPAVAAAPIDALPSAPPKGARAALRVGLIGCGQRGLSIVRHLEDCEGVVVAALCETDPLKRAAIATQPGAEGARSTDDWRDLVADPSLDALFILAPDDVHRDMATAAFAAGKHVFLEKPLATTLEDGRAVVDAWVESGRVLGVGTVLREADFYRAVKDALRSGEIGRLVTLTLAEQLGVAHGASFMRRWHRSQARSGGLVVHKGCHDLDLACWLADDVPARVASFGGRSIFTREAPASSCSQCEEEPACDYGDSGAYEYRTPEQKADPAAFGLDRCVYDPSSDIVDHQVVLFELANGVRGSYTLTMNGPDASRRTIVAVGERGRLEGAFESGAFEVRTDDARPARVWRRPHEDRGHGGGDAGTLARFFAQCRGETAPTLTPASVLAGFALATCAERARLEGVVVTIPPDIFA